MSVEEAVARKLCEWAEYTQQNWSLYLKRAAELIAIVRGQP